MDGHYILILLAATHLIIIFPVHDTVDDTVDYTLTCMLSSCVCMHDLFVHEGVLL